MSVVIKSGCMYGHSTYLNRFFFAWSRKYKAAKNQLTASKQDSFIAFSSVWYYFSDRLLAPGHLERDNQSERHLRTKDIDIFS